VDTIAARAVEAAAAWSARPVQDYRDLFGEVDAVIVAVPTDVHSAIAVPFLERGIPVLVEKPMSRSVEDADRMLASARAGGALLAVGHTERHNPAIRAAMRLVTGPRFIEVHRLSAFPDRSLDIDVVFDLMIHDLDLVLDIVQQEVASVEAVGVPVLTPRVDIANVRLRFANGCIANLTASRISRERVRKIRFFQRDAYVSIDYATQEVEMYRLMSQPSQAPVIQGGKLEVAGDEPLRRELEDFVEAVRQRRAPAVSGEQGRAALALAEQVVERMEMTR
jgi:predicted dehydrogenase